MKHICIIAGIAFFLGSILDTKLYEYIYLFWFIAFVLSWYGWSLLYSSMLLIATASYEYMSLTSSSYFTSSVLPWVFGISLILSILSLVIRYKLIFGNSFGADSGGDGGVGDC